MSRGTPTPLFVDTSGFYAAYIEDDANHARAAAVFDAIQAGAYGPIFTSRFVLAELATVIRYRSGHYRAVSTLEAIRASKTINVVPVTDAVFESATHHFAEYDDQEIAFFDHLGGALAAEYDISHVFTFDPDDFHTLGFAVVPADTENEPPAT